MPRADPTRSAYCASRHLLRNLDNAAELRRNPLVRDYFTPSTGAHDAAATRRAVDAVRGLVHASFLRCREDTFGARSSADLGRMHAALLRCDIDRLPLAVVSAELALSERQVRRERIAAHEAFARAFDALRAGATAAVVRDTATVRLAEATELHELGQSALAARVCADIASAAADPERRMEALCIAAEIDLDAARYDSAAARLAEAAAILGLRSPGLSERALAAATELIDLVAWSLRIQTGASAGLAAPPPLAVQRAEDSGRDEPARALAVRALSAYAAQRCDVGDLPGIHRAARHARELLPSLDASRTRERLAAMYADAQCHSLGRAVAHRDRFLAVEQLAAQRGHVRTMLAARADRIFTDMVVTDGGERVLDEIVRPFEAGARRAMPRAIASAARIAAELDVCNERALSATHLAERLLPPRNPTALFARLARSDIEIEQGRYDEARVTAQGVHGESQLLGNGRLRGAAARNLAAIAFAQHRRGEALRYIDESLSLLERYGPRDSLRRAHDVARRIGVA